MCSSPAYNGVFIIDLRSGGTVATLKNNACGGGCNAMAVVGAQGRGFDGAPCGGYLIAAQRNAPSLHIWGWPTGREAPHLRCTAPEPLRVVASTADGTLVAAGAAKSGRVFLWDVPTGDVLRAYDAHYRPVSALCFSDDGAYLFSAGTDAVAHAWAVCDLTDGSGGGGGGGGGDDSAADGTVQAASTWAEHTLPITALAQGTSAGGGGPYRVYTSSLDATVRLFELIFRWS